MKKNSNISFIKFIFIIYVIIFMFLSLSYILLLMKKSDSNSYDIEKNGYKYGNTQFVKYDNQISIPVPSGGRYFLENVDVDSFRVLDSQNYSDRSTLIVGLDKNSVYFGNIHIPDLDPNKLEAEMIKTYDEITPLMTKENVKDSKLGISPYSDVAHILQGEVTWTY